MWMCCHRLKSVATNRYNNNPDNIRKARMRQTGQPTTFFSISFYETHFFQPTPVGPVPRWHFRTFFRLPERPGGGANS